MQTYPILHRRGQLAAAGLLLALLVGVGSCGDPDGTTGTEGTTGARIATTTTGLDFDSDGYRLEVDGTDKGALPSNGTLLTRLDPGSHTIALTGLSPNCTIQGSDSRSVTIVDNEVAPIDFTVVCTATSGVIGVVISASGVGFLHEAMVDKGTPFPVGLRDRAYLGGVAAGDHVVSLRAPAGCSVSTDQQSVTVTAGSLIRDTVEVTFSVTCVPAARPQIAFVREALPLRRETQSIYIANADGSGADRLTSGEAPAWSPDGRSIAFSRGGTIYVIDADGSDERPIPHAGHPAGNPAWSPDGRRLVFNTGYEILVMNVDGTGLTRLIPHDFANPGSDDFVGFAAWSPDGRRISFVREPEEDSFEPWQVYIMNADGSDPQPLKDRRPPCGSCTPFYSWFQQEHTWSPDGSRIASGVEGFEGQSFWAIASVDPGGSDFRVHYRDQPNGYAAHPDWSPDGRTLVFEKRVTTSGCETLSCPLRIFVVSAEGGPARQLIPEVQHVPAYWDHQPAWSRAND